MKVLEMIPQLIRAGLEKDENSIEVISITMSNILRQKHPVISEEIEKILFNKNIGNGAYRSIGLSDIPVDKKSSNNLINIKELHGINMPILTEENQTLLFRFIKEQEKKYELRNMGLKPTNSILFLGEPGVGKTYSAKWLASELNKPLLVLDLATIMSSYLGETGVNIKKVLDYAKKNECILFLDEFDAIAKTRTDERELGEIKRIVNVLLKELEEWPIGSIIIAATNHEELLDKAIWRRFDLKIHLDLPTEELRLSIINREFERFVSIDKRLLISLSKLLKNENCAEVVRVCDEIKREFVLDSKSIDSSIKKIIQEKSCKYIKQYNKEEKIKFIKELYNNGYAIKEISSITGIPLSTLYRYIDNK